MKEQHHYKGNFLFKFYPANQIKIAKTLINYLFPKEIIKLAKNKSLDAYTSTEINQLGSETITALLDLRFPLLKEKISKQSKDNPDKTVLLFLLMNDVLKTIIGDEYINVQFYLAQDILIKALKNNFKEIDG
jgi:hypothetical protein